MKHETLELTCIPEEIHLDGSGDKAMAWYQVWDRAGDRPSVRVSSPSASASTFYLSDSGWELRHDKGERPASGSGQARPVA